MRGLVSPGTSAKNIITVIGDRSNWLCKKGAEKCPGPQRVRDLVKSTVGGDISNTYVVIHWVDYASGVQNGLSDGWYVYNTGDSKWSYEKLTGQRIYG